MALQPALALYGNVDLVQADVPYYRTVFNNILDRLEEKSPLVEGTEPGCIYIGLDGLELLYDSEESLVRAVKEAIPDVFKARVGIGEGKFLAYLRALYLGDICPSQATPIPANDVETFLNKLPCEVLPVSEKAKNKLNDYGIKTLGQLSKFPYGPLQAQFGPEGRRMLDLARGRDDTPLYPRSLEEAIEESTTLPSITVSMESLLTSVEMLLSRIFSSERMSGRGIRSLTFWTRSWNGKHWERNLHFKEPAMNLKGVLPRIKLILENYPQPGPTEQLGIRITRLGYSDGRQKSLFKEIRARDKLNEDIRQLNLRLGGHQVFKVKELEPWSRIPERRYALTPLS